LNITPATRYKEAHAIWHGMGIDPYDLLGKNAATKLAA
jgi:ubiquinone biosynthesis protein COQ4